MKRTTNLDLAEARGIEQDCIAVFNRYLINADAYPELFTETFTPDVIWIRPGGTMNGRAEMQQFIDGVHAERREANPPHGDLTRHMLTTASIEVADHDNASGIFYALVFRDAGFAGHLPVKMNAPELVVEYHSHFTRTADGWLIDHHEAIHVFSRYATG